MHSSKIYPLTIIPFFTSLIILGAYLKIPAPVIPITLQIAFVLLCSMVLKPRYACFSIVLYLLLGLSGLPVFSRGGGIFYVLEPTFGYLIGFLFAGIFVSVLISVLRVKKFSLIFASGLIGIIIIHLSGMIYMYFIMNYYTNTPIGFISMFSFNLLAMLAGDVIKCLIAAFFAGRLYHIMEKSGNYSRMSHVFQIPSQNI